MKIQNLAVIFVIIMLPISLILSEYTQNYMKTLDLQISYDSKLNNATYDAIKAFQLNTINNSTSDLANSKIRDIEASVNTFFNSVASNFNMAGYNSDVLKEYVPALVYTLYDGYYIYSPFINTLTETTVSSNSEYKDGEKVYGLKPYVYYSCRYKNSEVDVVITYSLDNYITIRGIGRHGAINKSGYLINGINMNGDEITYRGVTIDKGEYLSEFILDKEYTYVKINGVKYYYDADNGGKWFTMMNGQKNVKTIQYNTKQGKAYSDAAYLYYKEAYEFGEWLDTNGITTLKENDAVIENENNINGFSSENLIFNYNDSAIPIEEPNSDFNQHRLAVIRYSIEKNLSIAIANYNNHSGVLTNFQMPKLKDDEWDKVLNNVCLISFLQGLNIGGKVYNGYSIIVNNKNEEVVTEDSIYIASDGEYYQIWDETISKKEDFKSEDYIGIFNINFERKSIIDDIGNTKYYYPKRQLGSYTSIVSQTSRDETYDGNVYKFLQDKNELAKVYYTALGRERYSMLKVENNYEKQQEYYK